MSEPSLNKILAHLDSQTHAALWYQKTLQDANELNRKLTYCRSGTYGALSADFKRIYLAMLNKQEYRKSDLARALLLSRVYTFSFDDSSVLLTDDVKALYVEEIERIAEAIVFESDNYFDISNDVFLKDLAIVSHRFIPVGAEFVVPNASIERSLLLKAPLKEKIHALAVIARSGGLSPFFELHAHPRSLKHFNEQGWLASYRIIADLLSINPSVKGVFSASWFLDPAIASISPRLTYLRDVPADNGAVHIFNHVDEAGSSGALATSATRRELFERGKYKPTIYTRIWPRKSLIDFAKGIITDVLFTRDCLKGKRA